MPFIWQNRKSTRGRRPRPATLCDTGIGLTT